MRFPSLAAATVVAVLITLAFSACDSPLDVETPRNEYVDRVSIPQAELIGEAVSVLLPSDTSGNDSTLLRVPFSIAFVVDASGSIGTQTAQAFRNGCLAVLDSMDGVNDQGAVLFYNQIATLAQGTTTEVSLLRTAVDGIPVSGASAMWDGIYKAMLELQSKGTQTRKAILLFCDGDDNSSTTGTPSKITSLGETAGIRVYSIALGLSNHEAVLRNIVQATGGTHYPQPTLGQIDSICREIVHALLTP